MGVSTYMSVDLPEGKLEFFLPREMSLQSCLAAEAFCDLVLREIRRKAEGKELAKP